MKWNMALNIYCLFGCLVMSGLLFYFPIINLIDKTYGNIITSPIIFSLIWGMATFSATVILSINFINEYKRNKIT